MSMAEDAEPEVNAALHRDHPPTWEDVVQDSPGYWMIQYDNKVIAYFEDWSRLRYSGAVMRFIAEDTPKYERALIEAGAFPLKEYRRKIRG